jgi:hypothetical protein
MMNGPESGRRNTHFGRAADGSQFQPPLAAHRLWLLQRKRDPDQTIDSSDELDAVKDFQGIRCPLCRWQPTPSSTWTCYGRGTPEGFFGGCGTSWNTFLTRGRCPGCAHQWRWTVCLRCSGWSLHEDWYEEKQP